MYKKLGEILHHTSRKASEGENRERERRKTLSPLSMNYRFH